MTPAPIDCAAPSCTNVVSRRPGPGRPAIYCSPACRTSPRRPGVLVEVDHPDVSPDGRPAQRVWSVRLRRGQHVVVIANDLGWPSAHALAGQLEVLFRPGAMRKGGTIE